MNPLTQSYRELRDLFEHELGDPIAAANLLTNEAATQFHWIDQHDSNARNTVKILLEYYDGSAPRLAKTTITRFVAGAILHPFINYDFSQIDRTRPLLRWPNDKAYLAAYERLNGVVDQAEQQAAAMPPALHFQTETPVPKVQLGDDAACLMETLAQQSQRLLGR